MDQTCTEDPLNVYLGDQCERKNLGMLYPGTVSLPTICTTIDCAANVKDLEIEIYRLKVENLTFSKVSMRCFRSRFSVRNL